MSAKYTMTNKHLQQVAQTDTGSFNQSQLQLSTVESGEPKMNIFRTVSQKFSTTAQKQEARAFTRRAFLKNSLVVGAGVAMATSVSGIASAAAVGNGANGSVDMSIWTGWTKNASQALAKTLNGYSNPLKAVSKSHVVLSDNVTKNQLATMALNNVAGTEYFVTMSRAAGQPTSEAEAAQIVYSLSVWKVSKSAGSDGLDGISVEKAYSKSLRDVRAISKAMSAGTPLLPAKTTLADVRRYQKVTIGAVEAQAIDSQASSQAKSMAPSIFLPFVQ